MKMSARPGALIAPPVSWSAMKRRTSLRASPRAGFEKWLPDGSRLIEESQFDAEAGIDRGRRELHTPDGRVLSATYAIRYYPLPSLTALLEASGFEVLWVHGGLDKSDLMPQSTDLIIGVGRRP